MPHKTSLNVVVVDDDDDDDCDDDEHIERCRA